MSTAYWISYDKNAPEVEKVLAITKEVITPDEWAERQRPHSRPRVDRLYWTVIAMGTANALAGVIALAVYLV